MPKSRVNNSLLPAVEIDSLEPPIDGDIDKADGGVGLRHIEHPLVVRVARPDDAFEGTLFELYWGQSAQPVAWNFIREGDEGVTRIPLSLSADKILEDWASPVFVKVTYGDGSERDTSPLRLRVNRRRPGGRDPDPDRDGNQKLIYVLPPDVLLEPIDDERALKGVEIIVRHWENMAAYDLLIWAWGSETLTRRVQPHEVGRDIHLVVEASMITAAGNGETIPVGFQVRGATGNYPDEWAPWSEITWLSVDLNNERPEAPYVLVPDTESDIDVELLDGQNVKIGLWITEKYPPEYSLVSLIWIGTDSEGGPVLATPSQDITRPGAYEFEIDYALVVENAQARATVHFVLHGAEVPDIKSKRRYLNVRGNVDKWPMPTIDEQIGDFLDPNLPEVTVRFAARASWPEESLIEVVLVAGSSDSTVEYRSEILPPASSGDTLFSVSGTDLKRFEGYITSIYYILTQPEVDPRESPRREVQVGLPKPEIPAPEVEHALDGKLNLDDFADYLQVLAPVTDTVFADWITLYWIGPDALVSVKVQVVVDGEPTRHPVLRDFVVPNLDERVKVFYTLERSGEKTRYSDVTSVHIVQG